MSSFILIETDWRHDAARLSVLRRLVFIEEQGVPEDMEWDEHDADALHLLATSIDGDPVGCARLLPNGHVGRMAVLPHWRGQGVGKALLAAVLRAAIARGHATVALSAQQHATGFYAAAGFEQHGDEYDEAGIPHIAMLKKLD